MSKRISTLDFVKTWQESNSFDEFCKTTGMIAGSANNRATSLRQVGVQLKIFPKPPKIDVNSLNILIEEINNQKIESFIKKNEILLDSEER